MNPTAATAAVGIGLGVTVLVLWCRQQHERGRPNHARLVVVTAALLAITAAAVADDDTGIPVVLVDLGPEPPPDVWSVERGDHYWRIAERAVLAGGRLPTVENVDPYWRDLVAFNQPRRAVAQPPDVLHIGELIWLPDPAD